MFWSSPLNTVWFMWQSNPGARQLNTFMIKLYKRCSLWVRLKCC